jgi:16S rRNA (guanine(966)-N(2))-methyltransferase RsmD
MKVISGLLKGRNIEGYNINGTRPTMDRVKESLFGMIQNHIKDSIVLDLFAGSGQLGIEAISNGANLCYFIDNNKEVISVLNKNVSNLNIQKSSKIILSDWKKSLNEFANQNIKFDIIFVDPPYDYDVYEKILEKVSTLNLLNDNGIIVLEHSNLKLKEAYNNLILYKNKKYGSKSVNIYKNN